MKKPKKFRFSNKMAARTIRADAKPVRSDHLDTVRGTRATSPVNSILRSMAFKMLPEPLVRQKPKITAADIESMRPAFLQAYRERNLKAFFAKLVEEKGRNPHWWRQAFNGYVRLDTQHD